MQLGQGGARIIEGERWCPLLSPSYFYIVGIPSHVNIFIVDKEYILHCHLPQNKKTCEKNIF